MKQFLTKNQLLLLGLFYTNPDRDFYMQEIGRVIGKKPGVFQRTLCALVEEGILISRYRANARFFQVNKKYPLYNELKNIVSKTSGVEGSLRELIRKRRGITVGLIYGSFAKNQARKDSDIDLLIIGSPSVEDELVKPIRCLEKILQREINYKLYSEEEYRIKRKGGDSFLEEVLSNKTIILKGNPNVV